MKNPNWKGTAQLAVYKYQRRAVEQGATQNKLVVKLGHQHEIIGFQVRCINYAATLPPEEQNVQKKKLFSKHTLWCRPQITLPKLRLAVFLKHHQVERKKKVLPRQGKKLRKMDAHSGFGYFF